MIYLQKTSWEFVKVNLCILRKKHRRGDKDLKRPSKKYFWDLLWAVIKYLSNILAPENAKISPKIIDETYFRYVRKANRVPCVYENKVKFGFIKKINFTCARPSSIKYKTLCILQVKTFEVQKSSISNNFE